MARLKGEALVKAVEKYEAMNPFPRRKSSSVQDTRSYLHECCEWGINHPCHSDTETRTFFQEIRETVTKMSDDDLCDRHGAVRPSPRKGEVGEVGEAKPHGRTQPFQEPLNPPDPPKTHTVE